ncbi:MAG: hypothetical protein HC919_08125 [Oscillatoriales cyanobacterium SM2_2_1]|nr:hypothetical protein [Oscillatoriales cyanobacterium SM2_2_1]
MTVYHCSPLVRLTLLLLYAALVLPLPILSQVTASPISPWVLGLGGIIGLGLLYGALSQQVRVDAVGISVGYPRWVPWVGGWSLPWTEVRSLKPRVTGQGGIVYYFQNHTGEGFLLPMRIAGFSRLVAQVQHYTSLDTSDVRPLSQPWMYLILLILTLLLLAVDLWVIVTAQTLGSVGS